MVDLHEIKNALNTVELGNLVNTAAYERNCELDDGHSYSESADFLEGEARKAGNGEDSMLELVDILRSAETRWFELEQ